MCCLFGTEFTRRLWTDLDHVLLVYVGSAAEFALVEENHWLFYTDKLPSAPLDRLISTFAWNRKVMETTEEDASALAKTIRGFHNDVERERAHAEGKPSRISNAAFRAVGAMLIDYALRAEAYLTGCPVADADAARYYRDQVRFFEAMGITGWESGYAAYVRAREEEVPKDLRRNRHTDALFSSYRRDLGWVRYQILLCFMGHFLPDHVRRETRVVRRGWFGPIYRLYPRLHGTCWARWVQALLLPRRVRKGLG